MGFSTGTVALCPHCSTVPASPEALTHRARQGLLHLESSSQTEYHSLQDRNLNERAGLLLQTKGFSKLRDKADRHRLTQWSIIPNSWSGLVVKLVTLELDCCHSNFPMSSGCLLQGYFVIVNSAV